MRFGCSVVICTRNPRVNYLSRVLTSLREQTLPVTDWELLLVDNGSEHPLVDLVDCLSGGSPASRFSHEPELGLTPARSESCRGSRRAILLFVDDDNVYSNLLI